VASGGARIWHRYRMACASAEAGGRLLVIGPSVALFSIVC
jgi:hypothetical protein